MLYTYKIVLYKVEFYDVHTYFVKYIIEYIASVEDTQCCVESSNIRVSGVEFPILATLTAVTLTFFKRLISLIFRPNIPNLKINGLG